jgi:hypothetical protein
MAPFAETPILSFYQHSRIEVTKEPDLLDGWWTSNYLYSLERRAVFSKASYELSGCVHALTLADVDMRCPPQSFQQTRRLHLYGIG